jgi:chemotaxis protein CheD
MGEITNEKYIYQGDIFISGLHVKVITVLGSCVSVVLYSEKYRIGGINHGVYPTAKDKINYDDCYSTDTIYTDFSILSMLKTFKDYGIKNFEITAKVFGGADIVMNRRYEEKSYDSVGSMNIKSALNMLSENNIKVINKDTGGESGRKIIFYTDTGEVFMKYLDKLSYNDFDEKKI